MYPEDKLRDVLGFGSKVDLADARVSTSSDNDSNLKERVARMNVDTLTDETLSNLKGSERQRVMVEINNVVDMMRRPGNKEFIPSLTPASAAYIISEFHKEGITSGLKKPEEYSNRCIMDNDKERIYKRILHAALTTVFEEVGYCDYTEGCYVNITSLINRYMEGGNGDNGDVSRGTREFLEKFLITRLSPKPRNFQYDRTAIQDDYKTLMRTLQEYRVANTKWLDRLVKKGYPVVITKRERVEARENLFNPDMVGKALALADILNPNSYPPELRSFLRNLYSQVPKLSKIDRLKVFKSFIENAFLYRSQQLYMADAFNNAVSSVCRQDGCNFRLLGESIFDTLLTSSNISRNKREEIKPIVQMVIDKSRYFFPDKLST